ncbi:hypothetical protein ONE63_001060 [Megalurothrips usitatus]|uniref:Uncharacterized protein n=1 Tax=Megalurothrips usitatus TaxID=439358 RepID=A0AAV7XFB5_9NEOP|nr:hypothetical protein ONE63_001060 [Megalurothrips usitatus]
MSTWLCSVLLPLVATGALATGGAGGANVTAPAAPSFTAYNGTALVASTYVINEFADFLLAVASKEVMATGMQQIALPDVDLQFSKRFAFIKVSFTINFYDGWLNSLASLRRQGDVVATTGGPKLLVVDVPFGFSDLRFGFRHKFRVIGVPVRGVVEGTVASNAFRVRASVTLSDNSCVCGVDSVELTDLGGIRVTRFKGLGPINSLMKKISTSLVNRARGDIENELRKTLQQAAGDVRFDCDSLWA